MKKLTLFIIILFIDCASLAITTEVSLSYSRKKTTFDENNYIDTESATGSLSFYFWEIFALETSYTNAIALREEKASDSDDRRTIIQKQEWPTFKEVRNSKLKANLLLRWNQRQHLYPAMVLG